MNTKCLIVCESVYHHNTYRIARSMAQALGCRLVSAQEALHMSLDSFDTIGLGSGIYFGSHHPAIFEVVDKLSASPQEVFVFSSRGNPFPANYHSRLKAALVQKNKQIKGEFSVRAFDETGPWVIIGGGNKGRPDENDLKKAARFVLKIMPHYALTDLYSTVSEKRPVKDGVTNSYVVMEQGRTVVLAGDRVTFNHQRCNGCGKCAQLCPLGLITLVNQKAWPEMENDCSLCSLCADNCPQRAISLHYGWRDAIGVAKRHKNRTSLY